jgi:hypothetical protein
MDERARRIGLNEAVFRRVNEEIETLERGLAGGDGNLHIVCECGNASCGERLVVPVGDYERVRSDSTLFFVVRGHEIPSVEDVVEDTPRFAVVRKREGSSRRIAEETDPR